MDINYQIDKARKSLSSYCINECNALCCRVGTLKISEKKKALFGNNRNVSLKPNCQNLIENKCTIYQKRPNICKRFPLFLKEGKLFVISDCTAIKDGKLYKELYLLGNEMTVVMV